MTSIADFGSRVTQNMYPTKHTPPVAFITLQYEVYYTWYGAVPRFKRGVALLRRPTVVGVGWTFITDEVSHSLYLRDTQCICIRCEGIPFHNFDTAVR